MSVPAFPPDPSDPAKSAPSALLNVADRPKRPAVAAFLRERGIDPCDPAALLTEIGSRGWLWRLGGGRFGGTRCAVRIVVPWVDWWCWSHAQGPTVTGAVAEALALALASPPPPEPEGGAAWPRNPEASGPNRDG